MTADTESLVRTADFDYALPPDRIAQTPWPDRAASRLLHIRREDTSGGPELSDGVFTDLADLIPPGDLVVLNTTRVRHARLLGTRASGRPAEVLLIHPTQDGHWVALGKPGSALQPGKQIHLGEDCAVETIALLEGGHRLVRFIGQTGDEAIARYGRVPLPPYVTRAPDPSDEERYQTVYAQREGSVAAPTAGLHFTRELLDTLGNRGVRIASLDLEVGPGTFKPVEAEVATAHPMHPERFEIPEALVRAVAETHDARRHVWAIGTTVVRALEAAAGSDGVLTAGSGETRLLIVPGYRFRVVDRLVTNFHLPRSTLLMLVSAFAGPALIRRAYTHAIAARYRFYSYGDATVII